MKVKAVVCPKCGDTIYSRAHHDMHHCSCKDTYVDGGFEYLRVGYTKVPPKEVEIEVDATRTELYDDWNHGVNEYGLIPGKKRS